MQKVVSLIVVALVAWSCDAEPPAQACPAIALMGLSVEVTNAATGAPICDAVVTAGEGGYSERLIEIGCRYAGAAERPGTYAVRVERSGFTPAERAGVQVVMGRGPCPHVQEVRLAIALTPAE